MAAVADWTTKYRRDGSISFCENVAIAKVESTYTILRTVEGAKHGRPSWSQAARPPRERPVAGRGQGRAPRTGGAADRRRPHRRRGADVGARGGRGARPR